jgi:hypothetical protein
MSRENAGATRSLSRVRSGPIEFQKYVRWIAVFVGVEILLFGSGYLISVIFAGQGGGERLEMVVAALLGALALIVGILGGLFILLSLLYAVIR